MSTTKFKTTINCMGCVAKATPHLDEAVGSNNWNVDISDPGRVLTVETREGGEQKVVEALSKAGFKAEKL